MHSPSDSEASEETEASKPRWAGSFVDRVVDLVENVRSIVTQPALIASRGIVYGLVGVICALAALVLISVGFFRIVDQALPAGDWATYICIGIIFCVSGLLMWTRRSTDRPTRC